MAQKNTHIAGLHSAVCGMAQPGVGAPFFQPPSI